MEPFLVSTFSLANGCPSNEINPWKLSSKICILKPKNYLLNVQGLNFGTINESWNGLL
jgi:hypothetical protein